MDDLLDRRQEVLDDRARAKVDLGVDEHGGDETKLPALALEIATAPADQRAVNRLI